MMAAIQLVQPVPGPIFCWFYGRTPKWNKATVGAIRYTRFNVKYLLFEGSKASFPDFSFVFAPFQIYT